jgi:hypothetical protein
MAYRTLPAFLEMVRKGSTSIQLRGLLLTLSESEPPGGHWEREMRGRFGTRVLPQVIPYDEEVPRVLAGGQLVAHAQPDSAVGAAYRVLCEGLGLADHRTPAAIPAEAPLVLALQQAREAREARVPVGVGAAVGETRDALPALLPIEPEGAEEPPLRREPELPTLTQLVPLPPQLRANKSQPPAQPTPRPPVTPSARVTPPKPAPAPVRRSTAAAPPRKRPSEPSGTSAWFAWSAIVVAIGLGIGLRFVKLPPIALPIIVGATVTMAVVLVLRLLLTMPDSSPPTPQKRSGVKARPGEVKRPPRADAARLNALARRKPKG